MSLVIETEPLDSVSMNMLTDLGAEPFTSRNIDGSHTEVGFLIVSLAVPTIGLLKEFVKHYFQSRQKLIFKFNGKELKGYDAAQVEQILIKISSLDGES